MPDRSGDPLFSAAILKFSFIMNGMVDNPGFRVVYFGTIKELGLTDRQVDAYIEQHRDELEADINNNKPKD